MQIFNAKENIFFLKKSSDYNFKQNSKIQKDRILLLITNMKVNIIIHVISSEKIVLLKICLNFVRDKKHLLNY